MVTRATLKQVAKTKLQAAKILHAAGDSETAGYLLGYVVECSLKAAICKTLKLVEYPDTGQHTGVFASHSLDRLLILSGHSREDELTKNQNLFNNWSIVTKDWKPEIRYNVNTYATNIIADKIAALEDPDDGFFTWIKKRW